MELKPHWKVVQKALAGAKHGGKHGDSLCFAEFLHVAQLADEDIAFELVWKRSKGQWRLKAILPVNVKLTLCGQSKFITGKGMALVKKLLDAVYMLNNL